MTSSGLERRDTRVTRMRTAVASMARTDHRTVFVKQKMNMCSGPSPPPLQKVKKKLNHSVTPSQTRDKRAERTQDL
jgi:hypothetical protein